MTRVVHKLIAKTAKGIAAEAWEIMSSNDDFHRTYPHVLTFIRGKWHEFIGYARSALVVMLMPIPGTEDYPHGPEYKYSQHIRDEIEDALLIDGAGKVPAPQSPFELYPGDLVRHGSLH